MLYTFGKGTPKSGRGCLNADCKGEIAITLNRNNLNHSLDLASDSKADLKSRSDFRKRLAERKYHRKVSFIDCNRIYLGGARDRRQNGSNRLSTAFLDAFIAGSKRSCIGSDHLSAARRQLGFKLAQLRLHYRVIPDYQKELAYLRPDDSHHRDDRGADNEYPKNPLEMNCIRRKP